MEIQQDPNPTLISNTELLILLRDEKGNNKAYPAELMEFKKKTMQYLSTNCVAEDKVDNIGGVVKILRKDWSLSDKETIQILNLLPSSTVHLHLIIQNCSERFSDQDLDKILEVIGQLRSK